MMLARHEPVDRHDWNGRSIAAVDQLILRNASVDSDAAGGTVDFRLAVEMFALQDAPSQFPDTLSADPHKGVTKESPAN